MRVPTDLPQIALVRVETPGGPYRSGDRLSLAFVVPTVGRVVAHDGDGALLTDFVRGEDVVPETVTVVVEVAAAPYERGDRLTLAFVDPRVARIHPLLPRDSGPGDDEPKRERARGESSDVARAAAPLATSGRAPSRGTVDRSERFERTTFAPMAERVVERDDVRDADAATHVGAGEVAAENARADEYRPTALRVPAERAVDGATHGDHHVVVRLAWTPERVRRFVQVVDKLFTVDRLGWYRHALAMRLLIPDDVTCGDALGDIEAMRHVHALRAAAVETLGRPLLAAFMPNFSVSTEWLASLDTVGAARAVVGVRDALLPFANDDGPPLAIEPGYTVRAIRRRDLNLGAGSLEGAIAALVPTESKNAALTACLDAYRSTLVDVFGQTARAAEAVRVNGMTQPNHSLDDRLWQLVGAVGEAFDGLAVA